MRSPTRTHPPLDGDAKAAMYDRILKLMENAQYYRALQFLEALGEYRGSAGLYDACIRP